MQYYIHLNGQQQGPFEENELPMRGVTVETPVWCQTMTDWMPAGQVPALAYLFQQQPPQTGGYQQPYQGYQQPDRSKEVGFVDALKICFSKFADFNGRARRSEYWFFYLWFLILSIFTCGIGLLVCFIPMLAVGVRRLHDAGHSGWWLGGVLIYNAVSNTILRSGQVGFGLVMILGLVSLVLSIILLVYYCQDSQPGENEYGPNPKY